MAQNIAITTPEDTQQPSNNNALIIGTGLAVASMILVPAIAMRLGLGGKPDRRVTYCSNESF